MRTAVVVMLAAALSATAAEPVRVSRKALVEMEKAFDSRISRVSIDDPMDLLGATRGVYLDGFGTVLTAEANLVIFPGIAIFRPAPTKDEISKLRQKKQQRLVLLKQAMREMMLEAAASLDTVPLTEQIVVAVTLFHFSWEDKTGLPLQVLMQAPRETLLNYRLRRINSEALDAAIRVSELEQ